MVVFFFLEVGFKICYLSGPGQSGSNIVAWFCVDGWIVFSFAISVRYIFGGSWWFRDGF